MIVVATELQYSFCFEMHAPLFKANGTFILYNSCKQNYLRKKLQPNDFTKHKLVSSEVCKL